MNIEKDKYLIVIAGPTAIGKSTMAIEVAKYFNSEIISADSRQCYKEMSIGTAKPSKAELELVPHHFINHLSIHDTYSVGDFEREYLERCHQLFEAHDILILCGGTGLFIDALCKGLDSFPDVDPEDKKFYSEKLQSEGLLAIQSELRNLDPYYANIVDLNNPHRIIRALSVIKSSGKPYSSFLNQPKTKRGFKCLPILLEMDRTVLYERINQRVDDMLKNGLVEEAQTLYAHKTLNSLQTVGYQELFQHFDGQITLNEAIELIKRNSRRYAKRQMTWFRRSSDWTSFAPTSSAPIIEFIQSSINSPFI